MSYRPLAGAIIERPPTTACHHLPASRRTAGSAAERTRGEGGAAHPVAASVGSTEAARELVTAAVGTLRPEGTIPVAKLSTLDELHTCGGAELGTSSWMQLLQRRVDMFADATGAPPTANVSAISPTRN